jgi:cell division protein FtsQ
VSPGRAPAPSRAGAPAARFAERARQARVRTRRRVLGGLALVLALVGSGTLLMFGPVLSVRRVEVVGAGSGLLAQMRSAALPQVGVPLARVDTAALAHRLARPAAVRSVRVERAWPSTLRVLVSPRVAVAAVVSGDRFRLVDETGTDYATVATAPRRLPVLRVGLGPEAEPALRACLAVLAALPPALRERVRRVSAPTPDDVQTVLGSTRVVWGGSGEVGLKVRVLQTLLQVPAKVYDVSAPRTPVVR